MKGVSSMFISGRTAVFVVIAVAVAVYANTLGNGFVHDDNYIIPGNSWIREFGNLPIVFTSSAWAFAGDFPSNYYRPMMYVAYTIEYKFFGLAPWGWHMVNVFLNAAVSVLVFFVIRKVLEQEGTASDSSGVFAALMGALVFAVHPMHTEVVSWIACMPELLFTLFGLLVFYFHAFGGARHWFSVFFFLLSIFSKETAVMMIPVVAAYDYFIRGKTAPLKYAAYAAVVLLYFVFRYNALKGFAPDSHHDDLTGYENLLNGAALFAGYFRKLALPTGLNAFYILHPAHSLFELKAAVSVLFVFAYAAAVYVSRGPARLALVWAAVMFFPVLYIPLLGENTFTERYSYMPSVGFAMLAAVGFMRAEAGGMPRRVLIGFFAGVVFLYAAGSVERSLVWKDDLTFWQDTVGKSPDAATTHQHYGMALHKAGRFKEAEAEYLEALKFPSPNAKLTHGMLGGLYLDTGRVDGAISQYLRAVELGATSPSIHYNLALAYRKKEALSDAEREYREALRINPGFLPARRNLGLLYMKKGDLGAAARELEIVVSAAPDNAESHYNLGVVYANMKRTAGAIKEFEAAVRIDPKHAGGHNNLGVMYNAAGRREDALREFAEAERLMRAGGAR